MQLMTGWVQLFNPDYFSSDDDHPERGMNPCMSPQFVIRYLKVKCSLKQDICPNIFDDLRSLKTLLPMERFMAMQLCRQARRKVFN